MIWGYHYFRKHPYASEKVKNTFWSLRTQPGPPRVYCEMKAICKSNKHPLGSTNVECKDSLPPSPKTHQKTNRSCRKIPWWSIFSSCQCSQWLRQPPSFLEDQTTVPAPPNLLGLVRTASMQPGSVNFRQLELEALKYQKPSQLMKFHQKAPSIYAAVFLWKDPFWAMSWFQRNNHRSMGPGDLLVMDIMYILTVCICGGDLRDRKVYFDFFFRSTRSVFYDRQIILENPSFHDHIPSEWHWPVNDHISREGCLPNPTARSRMCEKRIALEKWVRAVQSLILKWENF